MTDYPFNADKPVKADTIANFCVYTEQNAEHLMRALYGFVRRAKFRWKDADEIYIGPGCYHHYGSTRNRLVWWNSELTFKLGSGGSNASSDDVDNSAFTWHYIYIDDSAVNSLASNELTVAEFLNDTTAPTWSNTYHGLYNGNDRCIGAVLANSSNEVVEFYHDGGDVVYFADQRAGGKTAVTDFDFTSYDVDTSWVDCYLPIPGFCEKALISAYTTYNGDASVADLYWRTNGQTGTTGHVLCTSYGASGSYYYRTYNDSIVLCDSSQIIEVKHSASSTNIVSIWVNGWYFPRGM